MLRVLVLPSTQANSEYTRQKWNFVKDKRIKIQLRICVLFVLELDGERQINDNEMLQQRYMFAATLVG